ncbi:3-dehydroquinate synthase [Candidatus Sumerlaeota bacterium]|nr:3-dehydroquinate synthase [Candidatus Sumerlaeota bacterium]
MEEIVVGLGERKYPIRIGCECARELGGQVRAALPRCDRLMVVTNPDIARLYAEPVLESLRATGLAVDLFEIPEGESSKCIAVLETIWDRLIRSGFTRQSALVALGGGVVGDVAGFAAATYMRGIDVVQVPTTLLAMVDSSVGGKTAVNHPLAKNIVGAFWQPRLVFMDIAFLRTLPVEEFRSGFAEVIKHGVIRDAEYFRFLEEDLDRIFALDGDTLGRVVRVSCEIKASVVEEDERESGLRAILNCGHTLGHAIEALGGYGEGSRHGEAVAVGMLAEARVAERLGLIDAESVARIQHLLERSGLPVRCPAFPVAEIVDRLKSDKKVRDGRVTFVLPSGIGWVATRNDVPRDLIAEILIEMGANSS